MATNTTNPQEPPREVSQDTETLVKKRAAVRQRLAMALLAVGGTITAAAIWFWYLNRSGN